MPRGVSLANVRRITNFLSLDTSELQNNFYKATLNIEGQNLGSQIAQTEVIGGSVKNIEKYLKDISESLPKISVDAKDLRKMIEEYNNLDKLIK